MLYYEAIMTNTFITHQLPERICIKGENYRRIFQRQIPGQQAFGIYRGIPSFVAGQVLENLVLVSEDEKFMSKGSCWKDLLREMEREQGRLRFLRDKAASETPTPAEDPLSQIRAAV